MIMRNRNTAARALPHVILFALMACGVLLFAGMVSAQIRVLHISPGGTSEVQQIINNQAAGSYFDVSLTTLASFNAGSPAALTDYDVLIVGLQDGITPALGRNDVIQAYLQAGNGLVLTHGTGCPAFWQNVSILQEVQGITCTGPSNWYSGTITLANSHPLVDCLFILPTTLSVAQTHTVGDLVGSADIVYRSNSFPADNTNFYVTAYTYASYGRVVVLEIGHSGANPATYPANEQRLFINSLYWAGQASLPLPVPAASGWGLAILIIALSVAFGVALKQRAIVPCLLLASLLTGGSVFAHPGHDWEADIAQQRNGWEQHIAADPDNVEYRIALANVCLAMKAEIHAQFVVDRRPDDVNNHFLLAIIQRDRGDVERALSTYRAAASRFPQMASLQNCIAESCNALGRTREQLAAMKRSLEIRPGQLVLREQYEKLSMEQRQ